MELYIMDMRFLYAALAIMLIIFAREFLRKKFNIDIDNININKLKSALKPNNKDAVIKTTGTKSLVLVDCGVNKATVMATLRQLTGLDYAAAKNIVESAPAVFMSNISEKEADMNKKALEYVGAKVEIK
jgi:ribosomal protein L7/L12